MVIPQRRNQLYLLKHFACLSSFAWKLSGAADLIKMSLRGHFVCKV